MTHDEAVSRYSTLTDKRLACGLTPAEEEELIACATVLDTEDAKSLAPLKKALRAELRKVRGRKRESGDDE